MEKYVYWTPYLCMHTSTLFEELGRHTEVIIACQSTEYGDFGSLRLRYAHVELVRDRGEADALLERTRGWVHVVSSPKGKSVGTYATRALSARREFMLTTYVEQYQWWTGAKGWLRRVQWGLIYNFGLGRAIRALGCTGSTGLAALRRAGVRGSRLFDCIYTVPVPGSYLLESHPSVTMPDSAGVTRFVYLGQTIDRKCVMEMVGVFEALDAPCELHIVGGGDRAADLERYRRAGGKIRYWGKLMPDQAREVLSKCDVLL